jgi:O-methyltransferase involved in polyketide biosynthesis
MYQQPDQVRALVAAMARHFPAGALLFDAVPRWFAARTRRGRMTSRRGYVPPPMPWGMDAAERRRVHAIPGVASLVDERLPRGRGAFFGYLAPVAAAIPALRRTWITVTLARFGMPAPRWAG